MAKSITDKAKEANKKARQVSHGQRSDGTFVSDGDTQALVRKAATGKLTLMDKMTGIRMSSKEKREASAMQARRIIDRKKTAARGNAKSISEGLRQRRRDEANK